MPLDDALPPIDDRTYDDLVQEVRTRVARYTPEWRPGASAWTDVNDSDPGVTLAQVFAWLSEMLIFRMNRVPALNYIKFLQLIGIELKPATPARAEVTFPVETTFANAVVRVPERAQLSAEDPEGGPALTFETVRAIVAFRAVLTSVVSYDPDTSFSTLTDRNSEATQPFEPFGSRAANDAFLALGFNDPAALPGETLDLALVVRGGRQGVPAVTCSGGALTSIAPAEIAWEYYDGASWLPLTTLHDETLAFTRTGHVQIKLPSAGISTKTTLQVTDPAPLYWIRARIVSNQYEAPPELLAIRTNTTEVEQAETVRGEVLGGSDGSRNQRFRLANRPVLADTLKLAIQVSEDAPEIWTEVPDLFGAGPSASVYMLNRTTGEIRTGDGVNGSVPVAFLGNPGGNVVAREYRFGGGRRGNVDAGAIATLVTPVTGIDAGLVTNLLAAAGGRNEETLEEAKQRAPSSLRSRDRAVTADDFRYLAEQAANIKRAKALPGLHPNFPDVSLPGVVSVVVVPDVEGDNPTPSDATLRQVCRYLDERRLITTEVFVLKPVYQLVRVRAEISVLDSADPALVHDAVVTSLVDYFHPLRGGEKGQGWPFGGTIHYSRVYQRVFSVPGVDTITTLVIALDGEPQPEFSDIKITPHGLLYSHDHDVVVVPGETEDA